MSDVIRELRDLLSRATPGPWESNNGDVFTLDSDGNYMELIECGDFWEPADAKLVAAAVNALPELLEIASELREIVRKAELGASDDVLTGGMERMIAVLDRLEKDEDDERFGAHDGLRTDWPR